MKNKLFFTFCAVSLLCSVNAQNISITNNGTAPDNSAMLDIQSSTMGLSIPNVALVATNSTSPIASTPKTGLVVYNTATAGASPNNVVPGYYYYNGTIWMPLVSKNKIHVPIFMNPTTTGAANYYEQGVMYINNTTNPASLTDNSFPQISNYIATTNGEQVNSINGWIWQGSTVAASTASLYLYKYTPTSGSLYTTAIAGTLVGSVTISLSLAANGVYSFTLTPSSTTYLNAGDVLVLWLQSPNNHLYTVNGTLEILANTQ